MVASEGLSPLDSPCLLVFGDGEILPPLTAMLWYFWKRVRKSNRDEAEDREFDLVFCEGFVPGVEESGVVPDFFVGWVGVCHFHRLELE